MPFSKGHIPWSKGKKIGHFSEEHKRKLALSKYLDKNPMWVGDKVGYHALHAWIKRHLPKQYFCAKCERLGETDLANISGKYLRDLKDWQWLCRRCHMLSDGRMKNLKQFSHE